MIWLFWIVIGVLALWWIGVGLVFMVLWAIALTSRRRLGGN